MQVLTNIRFCGIMIKTSKEFGMTIVQNGNQHIIEILKALKNSLSEFDYFRLLGGCTRDCSDCSNCSDSTSCFNYC